MVNPLNPLTQCAVEGKLMEGKVQSRANLNTNRSVPTRRRKRRCPARGLCHFLLLPCPLRGWLPLPRPLVAGIDRKGGLRVSGSSQFKPVLFERVSNRVNCIGEG